MTSFFIGTVGTPWNSLDPNRPNKEDLEFVAGVYIVAIIGYFIFRILHKNGMLYRDLGDLFKRKKKKRK